MHLTVVLVVAVVVLDAAAAADGGDRARRSGFIVLVAPSVCSCCYLVIVVLSARFALAIPGLSECDLASRFFSYGPCCGTRVACCVLVGLDCVFSWLCFCRCWHSLPSTVIIFGICGVCVCFLLSLLCVVFVCLGPGPVSARVPVLVLLLAVPRSAIVAGVVHDTGCGQQDCGSCCRGGAWGIPVGNNVDVDVAAARPLPVVFGLCFPFFVLSLLSILSRGLCYVWSCRSEFVLVIALLLLVWLFA